MMQFWNLIVCGCLAGDLDGVRIGERGVPLDHLDAAALGQLGDAAGELADDLLLNEGPQLLEVDLRLAERDAELGDLLGLADELRGVQQCLATECTRG